MSIHAVSSRYAQAEANARSLLGASAFRTKLFAGLFLGLAIADVLGFFWVTKLIADIKAASEGGDIEVVVLDENGNRVNVDAVKAADWEGPNTGMIVEQLRQAVTCVRGLPADPHVVKACWDKELGNGNRPGKFVERAGVMLADYANREYAPDQDALVARMARESVQIQHLGVTHPDDDRWALRWRERVVDRSGRIASEHVMTGTFTVRVVPLTRVDIERNSTGLQVIYYDWSQDPSR